MKESRYTLSVYSDVETSTTVTCMKILKNHCTNTIVEAFNSVVYSAIKATDT